MTERVSDRCQDSRKLVLNSVCRDVHETDPERLDQSLAFSVRLALAFMNWAIHFDCQLLRIAEEVENEGPNGVLSPKAPPN